MYTYIKYIHFSPIVCVCVCMRERTNEKTGDMSTTHSLYTIHCKQVIVKRERRKIKNKGVKNPQKTFSAYERTGKAK